MSEFWFWFWRPFAEFLAVISFFLAIAGAVLAIWGICVVGDWTKATIKRNWAKLWENE